VVTRTGGRREAPAPCHSGSTSSGSHRSGTPKPSSTGTTAGPTGEHHTRTAADSDDFHEADGESYRYTYEVHSEPFPDHGWVETARAVSTHPWSGNGSEWTS